MLQKIPCCFHAAITQLITNNCEQSTSYERNNNKNLTPWQKRFCASVISVIPKSECLCSNEFPCFTCKSAIPNFLCACAELVPHIIYFIGQAEHLKAFGGMIGFSSSPPDKMGWGEADSGNDRKKTKNFPFKWWHAATVLRLQGLITYRSSCRCYTLLPHTTKTRLLSPTVWGFSVE